VADRRKQFDTQAENPVPRQHTGSGQFLPLISSRDILKKMTEPKEGARILGVDYGRARIGLAIADSQARIARPLETLMRKNRNDDMKRVREIVRENGVKHIVLGLPLRMDGSKGEMAAEVERFGKRIRTQIGVPVEFVDERLTSWEAESILRSEGEAGGDARQARVPRSVRTAKSRKTGAGKTSVDAMAATLILREYLARAGAEGKGY
jgi:putative Holliday junction resolvase